MTLRDVRIFFDSAKVSESANFTSIFRRSRKPLLNIKIFQNSQFLVDSGFIAIGNRTYFRNSKICNLVENQELEVTLYDEQERKKMGFFMYTLNAAILQSGGSHVEQLDLTPIPEFERFTMTVCISFSMSYNPLATAQTTQMPTLNSSTRAPQIGFISPSHQSFSLSSGPSLNPPSFRMTQTGNSQNASRRNSSQNDMATNLSSGSFSMSRSGSESSLQRSDQAPPPSSHYVVRTGNPLPNNNDPRTYISNGLLIDMVNRWVPNMSGTVQEAHLDNTVFHNYHSIRNYSGYKPTSFEELTTYLGPLPPHISRNYDTNTKRWYFKDSQKRSTSMLDPRLESLLPIDPQLEGEWKLSHYDPLGLPLFMNSRTKTTTFQDPRTGVILIPCSELFTMHMNLFHAKVTFFHILCSKYLRDGTVKIEVNRQNLFETAFSSIMYAKACDLHRRPFFQVHGEMGLDYGGVKRELLRNISSEIMNPMYGLFSYVDPTRNYFLRINQGSSLQTGHLQYFRFFGRIIGLILFHRAFLHRGLSHIFFKILLGRQTCMTDIEQVDPELYKSLSYLRDNAINDLGLELYFVYEHDYYGQSVTYPLIEDGEKVEVTDENKADYLHHFTQYYFSKAIEQEIASIRLGVSEIVPITWLMYFTEKDLELLLCGIHTIDVNDWKNNTIYKNGFKPSDLTVVQFWKVVEEMDNETRSKLLQFCTGSPQIPVGGFSQLMGSTDVQKFTISKAEKMNALPKSHTCFNRLTIPDYKNHNLLKEKLLFAINETEGFHEE